MITFKRPIKEKFILKLGTTVKIRKNLKGGDYYGGTYFNHEMEKYRDKTANIVRINEDGHYILDICTPRRWIWTKEMLERPQAAN